MTNKLSKYHNIIGGRVRTLADLEYWQDAPEIKYFVFVKFSLFLLHLKLPQTTLSGRGPVLRVWHNTWQLGNSRVGPLVILRSLLK